MHALSKSSTSTEIYADSLHDALPISHPGADHPRDVDMWGGFSNPPWLSNPPQLHHIQPRLSGGRGQCLHLTFRSEEHTSDVQSRRDFVCRPLLDKKIGYGLN